MAKKPEKPAQPPRIVANCTQEQKDILVEFCEKEPYSPDISDVVHAALAEYLGKRNVTWPKYKPKR